MSLTYKEAGVNKQEGYDEINLIKKFVKNTYTDSVISDLGGFSALFELNKDDYEKPVLVSGTDGVGTKVKIAQMLDIHDTVGVDLVAMCVNDILCQGAKPLFFLDYIATGKLISKKMASIVYGVSLGCLKAKCSLIGGETAEMPGVYKENDYDLAGFCVGIVDKEKIVDGKKSVKKGNVILALPSSGLHSNGFSLVRKILFDYKKISLDTKMKSGKTLGMELLTPTNIYTKEVLSLVKNFKINAISHITGGGIYENIPRVLPSFVDAKIYEKNLPKKEIFTFIEDVGGISKDEMYQTFNMGVGMVIFVEREDVLKIKELFKEINEDIFEVGEVIDGDGKVILC